MNTFIVVLLFNSFLASSFHALPDSRDTILSLSTLIVFPFSVLRFFAFDFPEIYFLVSAASVCLSIAITGVCRERRIIGNIYFFCLFLSTMEWLKVPLNFPGVNVIHYESATRVWQLILCHGHHARKQRLSR